MFYKGNAIKKQVRQYIKLLLFPVALDHLNIILIKIIFTMLYLLNRLFGKISSVLKEDNVIVSRANELFSKIVCYKRSPSKCIHFVDNIYNLHDPSSTSVSR